MQNRKTIKDHKEAWDELVMLCNELESNKAKLSIVEFVVGEKKAYEARLFEEPMQEGGNKVLNIIRSFHPNWLWIY